MQFHHLPDDPPVFDTAKARARFAAAKADYLAGGSGPEVCERHGLSLRTFRWRASKEGWRRADQPAPCLGPDPTPAPAPSPPAQDTAVSLSSPPHPELSSGEERGPDAPPGAIRDGTQAPSGAEEPLTAVQMTAKAWTMLQAAMAAGQLIQARGWLRLYKELKPYARYEETEAREARMAREAENRRAAEAAVEAERPVIPEAPSGAIRDEDVAPLLHCFSAPESHAPPPDDDDAARHLLRLSTQLAAVTRQVEQAARDEEVRLQLHCFRMQSATPPDRGHDRRFVIPEAPPGAIRDGTDIPLFRSPQRRLGSRS